MSHNQSQVCQGCKERDPEKFLSGSSALCKKCDGSDAKLKAEHDRKEAQKAEKAALPRKLHELQPKRLPRLSCKQSRPRTTT